MIDQCDHIVEVVNATTGPNTNQVKFIKQSEIKYVNLWRDYNERLLRCEFCPKCGQKIKYDAGPSLEQLLSMQKALERAIEERKSR